jgi:hypothetical protein
MYTENLKKMAPIIAALLPHLIKKGHLWYANTGSMLPFVLNLFLGILQNFGDSKGNTVSHKVTLRKLREIEANVGTEDRRVLINLYSSPKPILIYNT